MRHLQKRLLRAAAAVVGLALAGIAGSAQLHRAEAAPIYAVTDEILLPTGSNWTGLASDGSNLVVLENATGCCSSDRLHFIDPSTGAVSRVLDIANGNYGAVAIEGGTILVGDGSLSRIFTIDPITGNHLSSIPASDFGGSMELFDNRLFYTTEASSTRELDPATGSIIGGFSTQAPHSNGMAYDGEFLYGVNSQDGTPEDLIRVFNPNDGTVISSFFAPSTSIDGLAFFGDMLFAIEGGLSKIFVMELTTVPPPDPNDLLPPPPSHPSPGSSPTFRHWPWHTGLLGLEETAEGSGCLARQSRGFRAVFRGVMRLLG